MHLEKITPANYEAALALSVRPDQQDLVEPVVKSLAEAYVFAEYAWPRLIFDRDRESLDEARRGVLGCQGL
jgi:diamine N-acetyltransferase